MIPVIGQVFTRLFDRARQKVTDKNPLNVTHHSVLFTLEQEKSVRGFSSNQETHLIIPLCGSRLFFARAFFSSSQKKD
jgi:hypothetical protein